MKSVIDLAEQVKDYAAAGKTIAPVENGTTAVGSYAIGEKFIREGVLYKAKTSITAGDTLTLNTNYELADNVVTEISDVKQALSNEAEARATLGAHNLFKHYLESRTYNNGNVTVTVNADDSITINGTPNADTYLQLNMIDDLTELRGVPLIVSINDTAVAGLRFYLGYVKTDGTRVETTYTQSSTEFTYPNDAKSQYTYIKLSSGTTFSNRTVYPMFRSANDTVTTYQPYSKTNVELTKDTTGLTDNQFENGAVNLLETDVSSSVINGLTITVNDDKSIKINGTATADTQIILQKGGNNTRLFRDGILPTGKSYKISGCPNGGTTNTYKIVFNCLDTNDNTTIEVVDVGEGAILNVPQAALGGHVRIYIINGTTLTNAVFKPMITFADVPNSDYAHYVPYAMTNKELTDVAEQTVGGYIYKGLSTITVTADGIKDRQTLLNELHTAFKTYANAHTDEYYNVRCLNVNAHRLQPTSTPLTQFYNGGSSIGSLAFFRYVLTSSEISSEYANVSATLASNTYFTASGTTISELTNNVLTSGAKIELYLDTYKQIS